MTISLCLRAVSYGLLLPFTSAVPSCDPACAVRFCSQ